MISEEQKEEIKTRVDIVDVIGEYVQLRKAGKDYVGLCPFHDENTPSFNVVPDKQFYHCFGCDASGDVIEFLERQAGMDFMEAMRYLAGRTGVALRDDRRDPAEDEAHREAREINAFAADWFVRQLADPRVGARAREYLDRRGIDAETRERFGLGWAPDEWQGLRSAAHAVGYEDSLLLALGLVKKKDPASDRDPYDVFRGRVMFPIRDVRGRVVAFGGRALEKGPPKYLNTTETPLYTKGEHLYGLDRSHREIRREDEALLVEGYMDLVSLAAAGFHNVVAGLGTALTWDQADLLKRYASKVRLLYDSDAAGLRATFKAADVLLASGIQAYAVTLPAGEDPDTLVQTQGADALRKCLDDAVDILERKLQILAERDWFSTADRKRDALDRLLPTLRAAVDPALQDIYVGEVADRLGMRRATIEAEVERAGPMARAPVHRPVKPAEPRVRPARTSAGPASRLLRVLAQDRERRHEHISSILESIGPEDFKNEAERSIFQSFVDDPDLERPPPGMDPATAALLEEFLAVAADPDELASAGRALHDSVRRLAEDRLYDEMNRLQAAIEATDDVDEKIRLTREKARLRGEASALGIRWAPSLRKHANRLNERNR